MLDSIMALAAALGLALTGYTLALILANWWADQWYDADGSPHHCEWCGSPWLTEIVRALDGGAVSETDITCSDCGGPTGYWAHGSFHPGYRDDCVAEVMTLGRWLGPLLAVGGALCSVW